MSGSKRARNQASIVNRQNVCGGPKKAGTAPRVGWYLTNNTMLIGLLNPFLFSVFQTELSKPKSMDTVLQLVETWVKTFFTFYEKLYN